MKATITLLILGLTLNIYCQNTLRNATTNLLKVHVAGGTQGFEDETYIHFDENATTAYDEAIDAIKWYSADPEATMIWTIASDDTELAINNLPLEHLYGMLNTIPMTFVCGYGGGEYTLTFSELNTFDESVEIWIEDMETGEGWIRITEEENTYNFTGLPDDAPGRFKIHILDPAAITSTDEASNTGGKLQIYASGNKVYIKNADALSEVQVYNLLGQAIPHQINQTSPEVRTMVINEPSGYYVVRTSSNNMAYSEKVYIANF